jgi:hypothetical protein
MIRFIAIVIAAAVVFSSAIAAEDYADSPSLYAVYADPDLITYGYKECAQLFSKCARAVAMGQKGGNVSACGTYLDECSVTERATIEGKVGEYFGTSFFCAQKPAPHKQR